MRGELPQHSPTLHQQAAYWRQRLSGELPVLELPFDHPRPPVSSFMREREQRVLGEKIYQKLRGFCTQHNISVFVVLLAALKILLVRYTGEKDVIVGGVPIGFQYLGTQEENENEGSTNPVVLRTDLSGNPMVSVILSRVTDTMGEAVVNGQYPFQAVIQDMGRGGVSEFLPFSVMFDMEELIDEFPTNRKSEAQSYSSQEFQLRCDFILKIFTKEQFVVQVEYDAELFEATTIRRLAGHYYKLLEGVVAEPRQAVGQLSLLTDTERQQLLAEWNPPVSPNPPAHCVHHLFEAQASRTPEVLAIVYEDQQLTYTELNFRANQLAHYLRKQGIEQEAPVGLFVDRSLEMVVGLLGILKAGGAYVPLDPSYPNERLAFLIADTQAPVLVTQQRLIERLSAFTNNVICLDSDWEMIGQEPTDNLSEFTDPTTLAYVIYTSGSTGRPKGILMAHQALTNQMLWMQANWALSPDDRVLQKTPFSFDVSLWEFFWPLLAGAQLIMARPAGHQDSAYLRDVMVSQGITTIHFVPSMLSIFLEDPQLQEDSSSLRRVLCGGEVLPVKLQERFFQHMGAELLHFYGPTEASITVTGWTCKRDEQESYVPLGPPVANTQVYVLNSSMQLVPVGVPGELYIGGVALARGYLNRPEQTAETFLPDLYSGEPGARMYRTGDLARYRENGRLEFIGRSDLQIKLRGYRIELGEIEVVLSQHQAVQEAVVLCREDTLGEKQLVAYVIPTPDASPNTVTLRKALLTQLPDYMVPAAFVYLETYPLTPNGKIDRKALPAPAASHTTVETTYAPPRTPLEETLAEMWADLLKMDKIGVHDNFFALGGHSLLATQVIARLRQELELDIPLRTLFEFPTVALLAREVETKLANSFPDWPKEEL